MDSNQINYGIKIWSSFMVLIMEHRRILVFHWDGFQIVPVWRNDINCCYLFILPMQILPRKGSAMLSKLAEWRSGSVSALPCERPGFASRTRLREIIPANNCTMQEQNNWGNWGSPGVRKLWVVWEVLRWLMKFREFCSGGFHPKLVVPPSHGLLNVNTPSNSQNS